MTTSYDDAAIQRDPRLALNWYIRFLALVVLARGMADWASILDMFAPAATFLGAPVEVRVATVFFAVASPVAAVGLWLLAAWGPVVWLIVVVTEVALHTFFSDTFGARPGLAVGHGVTIIGYGLLLHLVARAERRPRNSGS